MSYILALHGSVVSVVQDLGGPGSGDLSQTYARAKLVCGWPVEPNVRELTCGEYLSLREADNWHPPGVQP